MRRSEGFLIFSLALTGALFVIYRSPPILYFGLLYAMVVAFSRERLEKKPINLSASTITGVLLIVASPVFLLVRFGEYPSPATFQAFVLVGTSLVLFRPRSTVGPNLIAAAEALLAMSSRSDFVDAMVARTSDIFVDATSHLVRGLIYLFDVPITMNGNVAVIRNSVVIIGSGCSGLDAFVLYLLASLLLIYLRKSRGREAALLLLGALGIIPLNAVRIFTLLVIGYHSGISFLELFHSHLGDLMFIVYVFAYWWWVLKKKGKTSAPAEEPQEAEENN
ncbi:hypothetical protein CL1_0849 [Thermococcus cleftensis]|uniref:Exosortase/archaeosortase family protein n=1 Tax=Thermococcus cleftensis (strain DSM 27260 / KACC 17922 / CL1) TaxID=163003 RepID=I3ZTM0_THECF|nr:exosortase/archaeosortase family protein [Thermococcus cleftensis]AFL95054.1 hypothetical protein CL1_0849 [Thermococcus cleftensis]